MRVMILLARGESITPDEVKFISEKNNSRPNAKKTAEAIKYIITIGVALPGADTVVGTLPVPI